MSGLRSFREPAASIPAHCAGARHCSDAATAGSTATYKSVWKAWTHLGPIRGGNNQHHAANILTEKSRCPLPLHPGLCGTRPFMAVASGGERCGRIIDVGQAGSTLEMRWPDRFPGPPDHPPKCHLIRGIFGTVFQKAKSVSISEDEQALENTRSSGERHLSFPVLAILSRRDERHRIPRPGESAS
jgi:hypothetical protein